MTTTRTRHGTPLHFPGSLIVDSVSVIQAPAPEALPCIAASVHPDERLIFAKRLVHGAHKRRHSVRWSRVNESRLELAKLVLDLVLTEGGLAHA